MTVDMHERTLSDRVLLNPYFIVVLFALLTLGVGFELLVWPGMR